MSNIYIIMAFDFGIKKIGIAIGQKLTYTTQPLIVLKSKFGVRNWKEIKNVYNEWEPLKLVVGLPLQMNGKKQPITILAQNFAAQLKQHFQITVEMQDERISTIAARSKYLKYYHNNPTKTKKNNKLKIDSIAAEIILHRWFQASQHQQ